MTLETQDSTAPESQIPAPATTAQPAIVEAEATGDAAPEGDSTEAKPEKTAEQKELEYLRRKATKADRVGARLHQELQAERQRVAAYEARQPQDPQAKPQPAQVDPYELAREIASLEKITEKSNDVAKQGKTRFADFGTALSTVIDEAGPLIHGEGRLQGHPTPLGEAILDAEDPPALLHFLGSNPALAEELDGLSPTQLGRRIERFEAQMKARPTKPVSQAPAPIKPIAGGSAATNVDLDKADMATYKAARAKQGARWAR